MNIFADGACDGCMSRDTEIDNLHAHVDCRDKIIGGLEHRVQQLEHANRQLMDPIVRAKMLEPPAPILMPASPSALALCDEVARLHEELAKANGACADMAGELGGLSAMNDELEARCTELQNKLEKAVDRGDNYYIAISRARNLLERLQGSSSMNEVHNLVDAAFAELLQALKLPVRSTLDRPS